MPEQFEEVRLGEHIDVLSGFAFSSARFTDSGGVPLVRIRDLGRDWTEVSFSGYFDERYLLRNGDVLVGMDGDFVVQRWRGGRALLNQRVCRVAARGGTADQGFIFWALQPVVDEIHARTGATTVRHLSTKDLDSYVVRLPPLPEQRRIAEILDNLDNLILKTEQLIAKLKQVKQGLLHDLLTRGIDENGELRDPERHPEQFKDSPLGRIPKAWEVEELSQLGAFMNGVNKPKQAFGQGTKFVNISDVYPERLKVSGLGRVTVSASECERYKLVPGDVLIDRSSVKLEGVGYPTVFEHAEEPVIFCGFIIRFRPTDPSAGLFLCRQMRSPAFRQQVFKVATASANVNVNQTALGALLIAMPPEDERERIVLAEAAVDARIRGEHEALTKHRVLKSGLMEDLLMGRVRVTELEGAA